MEELKAKVGERYYLSMHRSGFGDYWCQVEILEVKKVKKSYYSYHTYSIKYHKLTSPYDEYYEDFQRTHYPNSQFKKYKRKVWVHNETEHSWNQRVLEV
jgi:hypothetical protein